MRPVVRAPQTIGTLLGMLRIFWRLSQVQTSGRVPEITLGAVGQDDLPLLFKFQLDPESNHMAAFTARDPKDRSVFDPQRMKILANEQTLSRAVRVDGEVTGSIGSFIQFGRQKVSYRIDRPNWGNGYAVVGLRLFRQEFQSRPLVTRSATDNLRSFED